MLEHVEIPYHDRNNRIRPLPFYFYAQQVKQEYNSLKEEITQNEICVIGVDQFNREYTKAQFHFQSDYAKILAKRSRYPLKIEDLA